MIRQSLLILAVLAIAAAPLLADDRPTHPGELTFDPLEVKIPEADRTVLSNGMVLYFIESHELPLVDLTIWFRSGSKYEPADKAGLAGFTSAYVRNGGGPGDERKGRIRPDHENQPRPEHRHRDLEPQRAAGPVPALTLQGYPGPVVRVSLFLYP